MPESFKLMFQKIARSAFAFAIAFSVTCSASVAAPDGKALFQSNCASCHNPLKDATGPALKDMDKRVPSREWLYNWIHNPMGVIATGDKYAVDIYNKWNKTAMTAFPNLSTEDIDAIVDYVNSVEPPTTGAAAGAAGDAGPQQDHTWLYAAITIVLMLLVLILWRVNASLRRAADEKESRRTAREIPLYRNKTVITVVAIIVFIASGFWIVNGGVEMGRQQNYMPEQPIFYSHKVHAGINQINCLYCHGGAEKSKHALIPSGNVCMNCHKQIDEYTGDDLFTAEGTKVDGTAEIHKLYEYTGWDPVKKDYNRDAEGNILAKPIPWVRVHNLPDHVYFNHSQHVAVGDVQCQQCHGSIEEMDEVYQFSTLSMGWCINCHRQTSVQFADNDYYSIYEKYHEEIRAGQRARVTVEDIGGLECQKCHY